MNRTGNDPARLHTLVKGRVQNVGFRAFVQQAGAQLGLTGWVRNLGDDQVEVLAEGDRLALQELLEKLRTGPRGARVDQVQEQWGVCSDEFPRFIVRSSR